MLQRGGDRLLTVFIAHTEADMDAAELLAKAVERRGLFVEHEGGEHIGRDLLERDVLVLVWSGALSDDPHRLVMERRALDAWAEGRLILVVLDMQPRPIGLRDLPAIEAASGNWSVVQEKLVQAIDAALNAPPPAKEAPAPAARYTPLPAPVAAKAKKKGAKGKPAKAEAKPATAKRGGGGLFVLVFLLALVAGGVFLFEQFRYALLDLPEFGEDWIAPGAGVLVSLFLLVWLFRKGFASEPKAERAAREAVEPERPVAPTGGPMFVSYAHDDALAVAPVVAAVERAGRPVWIDKSDIKSGASWAGEIVRAIRGADGVMVLCTPAAFRSDHVKREVYLADRYQKPLLPVMLAPAVLPEDFEYFFAGVQWLDLVGVPDEERPGAIRQALHG